MMQDVKISPYQFMVLVTFFSIGTSILVIPSLLAAEAKQDAWIVAIIATGIGLVLIWLFCTIAQWFPHLTFVQLNEKILGKWVGKATSLLFIFMSILFTSVLLYYSGIFLNTLLMPNTPTAALNILMAIIIVMGVRLGIETIARSAEILILAFFVLFLLLILFISPDVQFKNVQPILEARVPTIIQSSLYYIEVTSANMIVLLMIFPAVINNIKQAKKSFFIGYLIGGIVIIIITFLCISVLGADNTAAQLYASFELAKRISVGDFIQRIEAFMAALWIIALYFKATLYFYTSVIGIAQVFNMKDYRPITIPLGVFVTVLSLIIFPNVVYQQNWSATTSLFISFSIGLILPLLLIVVYAIRKKQLNMAPENY
ncbi:hypothetical protein OXB_1133 [Bacillus sp. OxB-1]|uniref:GerAB/ArcD/ProY family transporter n=1 Tax=Bacillus sp. (strain OxB-1) TaxID=98228 RepID=UPI000581D6AB|nr:endospore germination permease [Bacillus sp. OxB-1]BAQ09605.1 hypothetical protein OXB_1133 [Bacillus sp. OxB-1]